ncbi:MAG: hypothetical protein LBP61_10370 [Desulfovibrio sp.]|jgi:predicted amidohydrolase|nr:hypothetical protein [Desulfovibrio sp.]
MNVQVGSSSRPEFMKYKVAAVNYGAVMYEKERNIAEQYAMVEEAAKAGAKLIALPEMATTGYCWYNRAEVKPFVEPVPGPTTEKFGALSRRYNCWIVVGMPEVDPKTDIYYNSAVLIGPNGVIGVHRKSHDYIAEPKWSKQGDLDHMVFATPIGNIAMLICMDIHFIETARIQGLRNADVIVHISNWLAEKTPAPYWLTRAFDNGCYVLESNRTGLERTVQFSGGSVLINPDGTINSYVDEGHQIMYGEVDIAKARAKSFANGGNKYLERRPKEYMEIMHDTYLWNPLDFFRLYGYDPLPAGKKSSISVAQVRPQSGNVAANVAMIKDRAAQAAAQGSDLVVFPELTLTGLPSSPDQAKKLAETAPGPSLDALIDCAMKHRLYLVVGMVEKDGARFYNTAALIGPEGLAGKYRKMHLCDLDKGWATPGDLGFPHVNTPLGRIGMLIGHDAMFPEPGRLLALNGVDLICCPSAVNAPKPYGLGATDAWHNYPIPRGQSTIHWHLWRVRGGENNCYMAFANMVGDYIGGDKCFGRSGVFQADTFAFPRQEVILSATEEEIGTCGIDTSSSPDSVYPTNVVRRKDLVCMRLPHWYDIIISEQPPVLELFKK